MVGVEVACPTRRARSTGGQHAGESPNIAKESDTNLGEVPTWSRFPGTQTTLTWRRAASLHRQSFLQILCLRHQFFAHCGVLGVGSIFVQVGLGRVLLLEAAEKVINDILCSIFIHALLHVFS